MNLLEETNVHDPDLLHRLTAAVARRGPDGPLSSRLCDSYRELADADAAALTVSYATSNRVTLCATNDVARRLEDLQDVVGEGPGHSAAESGQIEICMVPAGASPRWSMFVDAAEDVSPSTSIHAVPMQPGGQIFGVITLYQSPQRAKPLGLQRQELQFLADVVGAALLNDPGASEVSPDGPWSSRALVHQATGMVVAQLQLPPDDALAILRAHAYAQQTTLSEIASAVVQRRIEFPIH